MPRRLLHAALGSVLLASTALVAPVQAAPPAPAAAQVDPVAIATTLLDRLDAGEYEAVEAGFTAQMAEAVPAAQLRAIWESLPRQAGAATGRGTPRVVEQEDMRIVLVPLHHQKAELVAQVVVDGDGRVAGLMIKPAPPAPAEAPVPDAPFEERGLSVGDAGRALGGTLAMPKHASAPVPGVVLVHGSGPQDRNETVGANRPFLDIARALAARGIAVLRYDKRTQARPQDFAGGDYDVDDETTDDAVAAVAALREVDGVDRDRVFVLGHSQGGMLAPRIAEASGDVAGLVMLAAPARPLLDLLPEQNRYLFAADGEIVPAEQQFLDSLDASIARIRSGGPMDARDTPLGLPVAYWRGLDAIDPVADALAIDIPILLLQGGRDFQVVDADWQRWRRALADRPDTSFKHYPALNHLGIAGQGAGTLAEYDRPGHVDPGLIDDVAEWILSTDATE
jgi:uncharacterized protein